MASDAGAGGASVSSFILEIKTIGNRGPASSLGWKLGLSPIQTRWRIITVRGFSQIPYHGRSI